jgi:hypothetical protein
MLAKMIYLLYGKKQKEFYFSGYQSKRNVTFLGIYPDAMPSQKTFLGSAISK